MNKSFKKHLTHSAQRMSYIITNDKHLGMTLMQFVNCAPKLKKPKTINVSGCLDEYSKITVPTFFEPIPINFADHYVSPTMLQ
jgi:hypothetical protein